MSQAQTFFHCQPRCRRSTDSSVFFCDQCYSRTQLELKDCRCRCDSRWLRIGRGLQQGVQASS